MESPERSALLRSAGPITTHVHRWRLGESLALAFYAVTVGAGVLWHESWADEAQAWLMARDLGWWQLMVHGVRYEGTPGLWHALLWVLIRLHVSFAGMHWVAAAFAAAAVVVLMRFAPFPRVLRLLLPFTFFLAYQDAVVARSYVLFSLLAFGAAALLRGRLQRPWLLALLLGSMANLSIHCFLASLGLAAVAWVQADRSRRLAGPVALLLLGWVVAVATAAPPPDIAFPAGKNISQSWKKLVAGVEHTHSDALLDAQHPTGELKPVPPPVHHRTPLRAFERKVARLLAVITFPLSTFRLLGLAVALLVLAHGWKPRPGAAVGRVGLVPYLVPAVAFVWLYLAPRHTGVLFVTFLVTAWLTWPETPDAREQENRRELLWRRALTVAMLLMAVEQIGWTAHALWSDVRGPYSGGPMTADFLGEHAAGKRVAGFYYHSVAVLPYFARNLYANQHSAGYWDWSSANRSEAQAPATLATHPDYVVVGGFDRGEQSEVTAGWSAFDDDRGLLLPLGDDYRIVPFFEARGYHETHRFCGHAWMRFGYAELLCEMVLEPDPVK
jgi:hypothetical protein